MHDVPRNDANWFAGKTDADILGLVNAYSGPIATRSVLGGVGYGAGGNNIVSAEIVAGRWEMEYDVFFDSSDGGRRKDPVAFVWEKDALCVFGFDAQKDRDGFYEETVRSWSG